MVPSPGRDQIHQNEAEEEDDDSQEEDNDSQEELNHGVRHEGPVFLF